MFSVKHKRIDHHGNTISLTTGPFETRDRAECVLNSLCGSHEYRGGEIVAAQAEPQKRAKRVKKGGK